MTRFIPKQFAENSTTSVVFGSHQEQGGKVGDGTISSDPATLQGGAAWPLGWSAATDNFFHLPRGEEMEGLERVLSAAIIQQFKDGLTFWQPEMPVTQYQTIVQYQTGSDRPKLYINITGTSTSTPPDSDTTNWFMFLDTGSSLANVDLSNLSAAGQAVLNGKANVDLSNLSAAGQAVLNGKANVDLSNLSAAGQAVLNGKANVDLSNLTNGLANTICATPATATSTASSARPAVVVENYKNGENWYRVWSDGWIEQGGAQTNYGGANASYTVSLFKAFVTTDYTVMRAPVWGGSWNGVNIDGYTTGIFNKTTTTFTCATHANNVVSKIMWYACGY